MRQVAQSVDDILGALSPLKVEWQDNVAKRVIERLDKIPKKKIYVANDVKKLLDWQFHDGLLICRLFLAQSKDDFTAGLKRPVKGAGAGGTPGWCAPARG